MGKSRLLETMLGCSPPKRVHLAPGALGIGAFDGGLGHPRSWMLLGACLLLVGALGLWLSLRARARRPATPDETAARMRLVTSPREALVCPTCQEEQAPGLRFCPHDGNRLVPGPVEGPLGGVCPSCGRGYDPGVSLCPEHEEELVPAALERSSLDDAEAADGSRVCPRCAARHAEGARFCGKDGERLEWVS